MEHDDLEHLSPDDAYARLNERFYLTSPSAYFDHRLNNLLVAAADEPELGPRLRAGIEVCDDKLSVDDDEKVTSHLPPEELSRFVTSESLVLFSHAAEAILRLYLGHVGNPACPWFEVSRLGFKEYDSAIKRRFTQSSRLGESLRREISTVFLGGPEHRPSHPLNEDAWTETVTRLHAWLRYFAVQLDEHRYAYNAAKHGFATRAGSTSMVLADDEGEPILSHVGRSLDFLARSGWDDGRRTWSLRTVWVSPVLLWTGITTAARMMHGIWTIGRLRLRQPPGHEVVELFVPQNTPLDYQRAVGSFGMKTISFGLLEEQRDR